MVEREREGLKNRIEVLKHYFEMNNYGSKNM